MCHTNIHNCIRNKKMDHNCVHVQNLENICRVNVLKIK